VCGGVHTGLCVYDWVCACVVEHMTITVCLSRWSQVVPDPSPPRKFMGKKKRLGEAPHEAEGQFSAGQERDKGGGESAETDSLPEL